MFAVCIFCAFVWAENRKNFKVCFVDLQYNNMTVVVPNHCFVGSDHKKTLHQRV